MNILAAFGAFLLALIFILVGVTRIGAFMIERANPPVGVFATINGAAMHHVHVPAPPEADLPPLVFIHGASGNLLDQMLPIRPLLEGRAEMLFLDRPGHGWSERGSGNDSPAGQADAIAALMAHHGMEQAVVVGHSFGGAITATLALRHPDRVSGLVFLAAATHPWPGGNTNWYYELSAVPVLGRLFAETLALPGGMVALDAGSACVFAPNHRPDDYVERAGIRLMLRPAAFRANAIDVARLHDYVVRVAPDYPSITAPTVVVTGGHDTVVYAEIHSTGLARDLPDAELVWIDNLGHKPDWVAPELTLAAIERVAGAEVDLEAVAAQVAERLTGDAFGDCPPERLDPAEYAR